MYAAPISPVTTNKSVCFAPFLYTISFSSASPMAVMLIINPFWDEVVSPPITSTLYSRAACVIPSNNSSNASSGNRLETATETVICVGLAFIAQISETLTTTAL